MYCGKNEKFKIFLCDDPDKVLNLNILFLDLYADDHFLLSAEFFSKSCVPGILEKSFNPKNQNPINLCEACGSGGLDRCRRTSDELYFGNSGAFRCLVEGKYMYCITGIFLEYLDFVFFALPLMAPKKHPSNRYSALYQLCLSAWMYKYKVAQIPSIRVVKRNI